MSRVCTLVGAWPLCANMSQEESQSLFQDVLSVSTWAGQARVGKHVSSRGLHWYLLEVPWASWKTG